MDKEQFSKLLNEQQKRGKELLSLISNMHEGQNDFGDGMAMFGGEDLFYVPEDELDEFTNKFEGWKSYVLELLVTQFGGNDQYVYDWDSNIGTYISKREPILPQLKKKVNKGLALIDSFLQRLNLHFNDYQNAEKALKQNRYKTPMVFISHSSKDKDFAEALVVLLEDLGMDSTNLFCSSIDGYGVGLSQDIFETLRSLFNEHNLFVIFIHSPRYYKSPVSLNEMGAAWVLKTDFCSFLTTDMEFGMMKGVVNGSTISIKVDNDDTPARLSELKDKLTSVFELPTIDGTKWERKRQAFLDKVLSIEYNTPTEDITEPTFKFSSEELQIFSKWANNVTDKTYIVVKTRAGLEVHFGYRNGYTFSYGEEEASFEDFMQRLQAAGLIVADRYDDKNHQPIYKITKKGYDYAKTITV